MRAAALLFFSAVFLVACGGSPKTDGAPATRTTMTPKRAAAGELTTYKGGEAIGKERWTDDGERLTSTLELSGATATVTIDRPARRVRVESGGTSIERDVAEGMVALENGSWQAYAVAAESFAHASTPTPVKVLVPGQGAVVDGTIRVTPAAGGAGRVVTVEIGPLAVTAEIDARGRVVRATVPAQDVEAQLATDPPPPKKAAPEPPDFVVEEAVEVTAHDGVALRGSLWVPRDARGPVPAALVIAGSGPTDRDGNGKLGLRTDAYRMLAEELAKRGIATLRYDKRGVGASSRPADPAAATIDDFVSDAASMLGRLRDPARFSKVSVVGHSEGGLVALLLARKVPVDALVLVGTAGRPLRAVLREQLSTKVDAATMAEVDRILADISAGRPVERVPPALAPLFSPTVATFLRSVIDVDPAPILRGLSVKTTVVQGETDAQIGVADANLLGKARPGVEVAILPRVNHVLKEEASIELPQASYTDPSRPIARAAVDAIARGIVGR